MNTAEEKATGFQCDGSQLIGVLHLPAKPRSRGVVIVPGAPQYRIGSHRQFLLLARDLAAAGFPVLRFDYRGMGDSDGVFVGFEGVDEDIGCAVDCLIAEVAGVSEVVLWGLCDGASAASFYAKTDPRVCGLVLLNPWVRTDQTVARARLSGYYLQRLVSRAFWDKALGGKLDLVASLRGLAGAIAALAPGEGAARQTQPAGPIPIDSPASADAAGLPDRVGTALRGFDNPTLVILSGADLTAQEFRENVVGASAMRSWRRRRGVEVKTLDRANHTYATRAWRQTVHDWTISWLKEA